MNSKKKKVVIFEERSDYEKFAGACEGLKDVLNEKLCDNFLMITNRYVDSEIQKYKAYVLPPALAEIQTFLLEYAERCKNPGFGIGHETYLKHVVIKKIKELYGN